ncbi:MAG: NTP transferase domain-containing protein [Clostridiales bacterium]|jgi:NDP-sugar pyrophosphorylase family protein|nr:NTP transferase domain-containing protein [Clostridiales bacterium]
MMDLVLLCGGLAARMRPITEKIPKSMIEINGKPFIHHQLSLLRKKGVRRVIACAGYLGEQIVDYIGDGRRYSIKVDYFFDKLSGTGGALRNITGSLPDDFFVLYGDSYLDTDYQKVEDAYRLSGKKALMTVYRNEGEWDAGNVIFRNNEILCYSKKHKAEGMNYIDYGLGILNRSVLFGHEQGAFDLSELHEALSARNELAGFEVFERFYEIGSPQGLRDLREKLGGT